jgi:hypothetical protein
MTNDDLANWVVALVIIGGGCLFGHRAYKATQTPEALAAHDACYTPRTEVLTEKDGIKLYKYSRNCYDADPVYFSAAGTTTTHAERHGKTSETVTDIVPNTQVTP